MPLRGVLIAYLVSQLACVHDPGEHCAVIAEGSVRPSLPSGFAEVDRTLVERTRSMTDAARALRGSLARSFRIYYSEDTLPLLCGRLEQARALATNGRAREAGMKYQALLVASQVIALAIALHGFSEYADELGAPLFRIAEAQEHFAGQLGPLLEAALSEDPARIDRALRDHGTQYRAWVDSLGRWSRQLNAQTEHLKIAKLVWDCSMLAVALSDAAGSAAELATVGRPPAPPSLAFAPGAVVSTGLTGGAYIELTEALRRLIASGALDASIVTGLSKTLGGGGTLMSAPELPGAPDGLEIRRDVTLSGGRSGERVKELMGPPNSAVRGGEGRAFITNERGQVIRDVTQDRVKEVTPGVGFGPKRVPTAAELQLLKQLWGDGT